MPAKENTMNPMCPKCNVLLSKSGSSSDNWEIYHCPNCKYCDINLIGDWLPTDSDTNHLFYKVARILAYELPTTCQEAINIAEDYYSKFTDKKYCESLGIPVQDDDFFHHESAKGMVLRAVYYLVQNNDPNPKEYINWRQNVRRKA